MRLVLRIVATSVFVVLAILLAGPQQLGGPIAVMSTSGDSMLPHIRPHHLVLVRSDASYDIGEVIAFRSQELGSVVLHRVVGVDQRALLTQGDNNDWLDPDRPTASDVIGQAWLTIPQAGRLLELPGPVRAALALLALGGTVATFRGARAGTKRRDRTRRSPRRDRQQRGGAAPPESRRAATVWQGLPHQTLLGAGVVLCAGAILAGLSWTRPVARAGPVDYEQHGRFSYEATVPRGEVYPDGRIDSGEPVFLRIADRLDVAFDWKFEGAPTGELRGAGQLSAVVEDGSGWSRTLPLGPALEWTGPEARLVGELDLAAIRRLTDRVADATGVAGSTRTVHLTAEVAVEGDLAGAPFVAQLDHAVTFQTDEVRAVLTTPAVTDGADPLTVTEAAQVTAPAIDPSTLTFGGRTVPVGTARPVSLVLLGLGGLLALIALVLARRTRRWDEHRRIRDHHGHAILPVSSLSASGDRRQVALSDIDQLVSLAERRDLPVLRVPLLVGGHGYVVDDTDVRYRYLPAPSARPGSEGAIQAGARSAGSRPGA